jgi:serine-aspartate repeat-containing protein C/D/E
MSSKSTQFVKTKKSAGNSSSNLVSSGSSPVVSNNTLSVPSSSPSTPVANNNSNNGGCAVPPPPPPLNCGVADNSGILMPPHTPPAPVPTPTGQPQVSLVGDSNITEGGRSSYRLQLDRVAATDLTFTIRVSDGTAIGFEGDGSGQSTKGSLKKGLMPELNRDYTVSDAQGQIINGDTITLTIKAGSSTSESIAVQTWQERVSMSGRNVITPDTQLGEGNEKFSIDIVDACGCQVAQPQMPVTIIDQTNYKWHSPLVIDLNGDGVKTLGLDKGVEFDLLNTGSKVNVGWVSAKDGLLAVDSNGNGKIDNGNELFGGGVGDGFAKLDSFDSNRDGIVDAKDKNFGSLKIWQDGNSNGVTDKGELQALSVFGIKSLNVAHEKKFELDKQDNILGERGSVTTTNGKSLDMIDVYFQVASVFPTSSVLG